MKEVRANLAASRCEIHDADLSSHFDEIDMALRRAGSSRRFWPTSTFTTSTRLSKRPPTPHGSSPRPDWSAGQVPRGLGHQDVVLRLIHQPEAARDVRARGLALIDHERVNDVLRGVGVKEVRLVGEEQQDGDQPGLGEVVVAPVPDP